jgi:hypothetical protein
MAAVADHVHTWPGVVLAPGFNTVEVTGVSGGATYTDTVRWTLTR